IDARVDTPEQAASIIAAALHLRVQNGMLFGVPVPEAVALPSDVAEAAIAQATQEADEQGISGKEITPFVLGRVKELTEGASMAANTALLENNARVGGQIAVALSRELVSGAVSSR
ncbi:MAG: pseudouridine-5'-phosphate glycosidase, partial [Chloroflexota bacterium]